MTRPVIYHVLPRLFGNQNTTNTPNGTIAENGVGKFNDFTDKALKTLRSLGYTHIWYTGILEHATQTDYSSFGIRQDHPDIVKGKAGSPYAVKDYYDVDPDLAVDVSNRMQEFEALVSRTHNNGLKVLIDFIPNHLARQYHSDDCPANISDFGSHDDRTVGFSPSNNFYYLPDTSFASPITNKQLVSNKLYNTIAAYSETPAKVSGNDVFSANPAVTDWFETIKLNYGIDSQNSHQKHFDPIPNTWIKMKEVLLYWLSKGCDGFRGDMVEMVPTEFWKWVIAEVKTAYPTCIFIGEAYQPHNYHAYFTAGFDYLYDKSGMYDTLRSIVQHQLTADSLTWVWQGQEGFTDKMLRFLENHDEQRVASKHFAGNPTIGIPMMAAAALLHRGPVMLYCGQEVGETAESHEGFSTADGRTSIFDYCSIPQVVRWINSGKFDGKKLPQQSQKLHNLYTDLLRLVNTSSAIQTGNFYDLQFFNRNQSIVEYSDRVYAFLRYSDQEALLIVINFDSTDLSCPIRIPEDAWNRMKIIGDYFKSKHTKLQRHSTFDYQQKSQLIVTCEPFNYVILPLSNTTNPSHD